MPPALKATKPHSRAYRRRAARPSSTRITELSAEGCTLPVPDIPRLVSGATIGIVAEGAAIPNGNGNCFETTWIVNRKKGGFHFGTP